MTRIPRLFHATSHLCWEWEKGPFQVTDPGSAQLLLASSRHDEHLSESFLYTLLLIFHSVVLLAVKSVS